MDYKAFPEHRQIDVMCPEIQYESTTVDPGWVEIQLMNHAETIEGRGAIENSGTPDHAVLVFSEYREFLCEHRKVAYNPILDEKGVFGVLMNHTAPTHRDDVREAAMAAISTSIAIFKDQMPVIPFMMTYVNVIGAVLEERKPILAVQCFRCLGNVVKSIKQDISWICERLGWEFLMGAANFFFDASDEVNQAILHFLNSSVHRFSLPNEVCDSMMNIYLNFMQKPITRETCENRSHRWALQGIVGFLSNNETVERVKERVGLLMEKNINMIIDRYFKVDDIIPEKVLAADIFGYLIRAGIPDMEAQIPAIINIIVHDEITPDYAVHVLSIFEAIIDERPDEIQEMIFADGNIPMIIAASGKFRGNVEKSAATVLSKLMQWSSPEVVTHIAVPDVVSLLMDVLTGQPENADLVLRAILKMFQIMDGPENAETYNEFCEMLIEHEILSICEEFTSMENTATSDGTVHESTESASAVAAQIEQEILAYQNWYGM